MTDNETKRLEIYDYRVNVKFKAIK